MSKCGKVIFDVDTPKNPPAFVISAACYSTAPENRPQPIPINIYTGLSAIAMRFVTNDDNKIVSNVSVDSCTGFNIENLRVHQWEDTIYPQITKNWIEHDDKNKFEPLGLICAVADNQHTDSTTGKLSSTVTYYTQYKSRDNYPILLLFGLGKEVAVNTIISKSTLKL